VGELLISQRRGEELETLATTDDLTGLANRTSFSDRLNEEIAACQQTGESFGVILVDLDRFQGDQRHTRTSERRRASA